MKDEGVRKGVANGRSRTNLVGRSSSRVIPPVERRSRYMLGIAHSSPGRTPRLRGGTNLAGPVARNLRSCPGLSTSRQCPWQRSAKAPREFCRTQPGVRDEGRGRTENRRHKPTRFCEAVEASMKPAVRHVAASHKRKSVVVPVSVSLGEKTLEVTVARRIPTFVHNSPAKTRPAKNSHGPISGRIRLRFERLIIHP